MMMATADKANPTAAVIGAIGAVIAAGIEIKRWMSEKLVLDIVWRTSVAGSEVEALGVHRGLVPPSLPTYVGGPYGPAMQYMTPNLPCKNGYLVATLTKRSKTPPQLRDIFLEMTTPDRVTIRSLPHGMFSTLGLNEPHHFFAPHDEVDLTNAAIVIETDRETSRKHLALKN